MIKKIEKGYAFEKHNRIGGYLTQSFALYQLITLILDFYDFDVIFFLLLTVSLLAITIGLALSFTKEFIIIDYSKFKLSRILNLFGFELKKEINLKKYKYITVLTKRFSYDDGDEDNYDSWGDEGKVYFVKYEVVFINKTHRIKFLIERYETFEEAKAFGEELVKYTGLPLVKYAPKRLSKSPKR